MQESPGGVIVGVHSALANKMALQLLQQHLLPELEPYTSIQQEVGKLRVWALE
jgi:DNA-binding sugar fermentation-stimulating protein